MVKKLILIKLMTKN